jgi:poly [ADP-ribose] polymerase 2/3/4
VAAKITAQGIETPLGILTLGQIDKGEQILKTLFEVFKKKPKGYQNELERLSGDFYSAIPHRIGRTRQAIEEAIIDTMEEFEQKQETLQLMKDMLQVNGEHGGLLAGNEIDAKYEALGCEMDTLDKGTSQYKELTEYVVKSQIKSKDIKIQNIYTLKRTNEWGGFTEGIENQRLLFHGSRAQNWVGILSRGILMPKLVVSMGGKRTDAGWLGNGIYFGDAACTSAFYTTPTKQNTRYMAVARVALGKMKEYTKITYGITEPPAGFHSCRGVRATMWKKSEFEDDEYVIYKQNQQRLEFLVEFKQ